MMNVSVCVYLTAVMRNVSVTQSLHVSVSYRRHDECVCVYLTAVMRSVSVTLSLHVSVTYRRRYRSPCYTCSHRNTRCTWWWIVASHLDTWPSRYVSAPQWVPPGTSVLTVHRIYTGSPVGSYVQHTVTSVLIVHRIHTGSPVVSYVQHTVKDIHLHSPVVSHRLECIGTAQARVLAFHKHSPVAFRSV